MDLEFSEEQRLLLDSLDRILDAHRGLPTNSTLTVLPAEGLRETLLEGGFFEAWGIEDFGPVVAAEVVSKVAALSATVEVAASAIVAPALGLAAGAPVALATRRMGQPVRFLAPGSRLVLLDDAPMLAEVAGGVDRVDTDWAYPFGMIGEDAAEWRPLNADRDRLVTAWRLALAAEIAGVATGAFDLTIGYVKEREQFGRPIGAFQALQHRLSEAATLLTGLRQLVRAAAHSGAPVDAAIAASAAQDLAGRITYETQQMHGAIGQTLEYPLHFWTYRLRALQGELGGADAQAGAAADLLWPDREVA